MRILWVKAGGLWPANTGGRTRSLNLISELAREHRVTLLTTHADGDDAERLRARLPHCERVDSIQHSAPKLHSVQFAAALARSWLSRLPADTWRYRVPALRREAARAMANGAIDLCVADFLFAVPNVPMNGRVPVVLFAHNVEHMIWRRLCAHETVPWRRALLEYEWRKLRRFEAAACRDAKLTIAVSAVDRALLAENAPGARVREVPTGVDVDYFAPWDCEETPDQLVFTGSMDWYPNEDAILYFIDEILPLIRHAAPRVSLTVVGRNPRERLVRAARRAGVGITGTVDDVRPYVGKSALYVVPLRIGGGTRLKIFEALAMGKAVVATGIGAEGLPLENGRHYLRADRPAEFADAVVALLGDRARRRALGAAGRELMESRYSWPQVAREFEGACREVLA